MAARSDKNTGLPANLYPNRVGKKIYWVYLHPVTKVKISLGSSKPKAVRAAKLANEQLLDPEETMLNRILGNSSLRLSELVESFIERRVPQLKWKSTTRSNMLSYLKRYSTEFGDRYVQALDVGFFAEYLEGLNSHHAWVKHRSLLIKLMQHAVARGLIESNPVTQTETVAPPERQRQRLTIETYKTIRGAAEPWLQTAMDLLLVTALRPVDAVRIKHAMVNEGYLEFGLLAKTETYTDPVRWRTKMTTQLTEIFAGAKRSHVPSPFVIHKKPVRRKAAAWREHWTQVNEEYLGKAFAKVRDTLPEFQAMPPAERPTLYEIKSLSVHIYENILGFDRQYTQKLVGHKTEKMTGVYAAGHDAWHDASADLDLSKLFS